MAGLYNLPGFPEKEAEMIDNETIYGIEFYSQTNTQPGFVVTFTGEEIKQLLKQIKKKLDKDSVRIFQNPSKTL